MNRKRFDAEIIRDASLAVAGTLNPKLGGRPVRIPIEPEVYNLHLHRTRTRRALAGESGQVGSEPARHISTTNARSACHFFPHSQPTQSRRVRYAPSAHTRAGVVAVQQQLHAGSLGVIRAAA